MKKILLCIFCLVTVLLLTGCGSETSYAPRESYTELNIQELHNDYDGNEIAAKDKYPYNYYYFTGEIHDVTEYLTDTYLEFMFHSDNPNAKTSTIEITAYFDNGEMLKDVTKGQTVTVYCRFKGRTVENYFGTTGYSLGSCHFGDRFVTTDPNVN